MVRPSFPATPSASVKPEQCGQREQEQERQQIDNGDGQRAWHPVLEQPAHRNQRIGKQRCDDKEQQSGDEMANQPEEDENHNHPDEDGDAHIARIQRSTMASLPRYPPAMQNREKFPVVRACIGCAIQHRDMGMPGCERGL